jgi:hypothetical protein
MRTACFRHLAVMPPASQPAEQGAWVAGPSPGPAPWPVACRAGLPSMARGVRDCRGGCRTRRCRGDYPAGPFPAPERGRLRAGNLREPAAPLYRHRQPAPPPASPHRQPGRVRIPEAAGRAGHSAASPDIGRTVANASAERGIRARPPGPPEPITPGQAHPPQPLGRNRATGSGNGGQRLQRAPRADIHDEHAERHRPRDALTNRQRRICRMCPRRSPGSPPPDVATVRRAANKTLSS